jgi:hypothetical protein
MAFLPNLPRQFFRIQGPLARNYLALRFGSQRQADPDVAVRAFFSYRSTPTALKLLRFTSRSNRHVTPHCNNARRSVTPALTFQESIERHVFP